MGNDQKDRYDAIVVGAGPGGCTAATLMARSGLRVVLLEKERFPRDKICGDAISGKSVGVLKELGLLEKTEQAESIVSWGATFSSPRGDEVSIPFTNVLDRPTPPGFVCARTEFDEILFDAAVDSGVEVRQDTRVTGLLRNGQTVIGVSMSTPDNREESIDAPVTIGADGAYSVVSRELGINQLDERHYVAGIRAYYRNVSGFHERNYIEIHFVDEVLPGYFWIFPMANGGANVGLGMLSSLIKKKNIRLKELLEHMTKRSRFAHRFEHAEKLAPTKGWGLPLGSRPRPMAGDGWMLVGDAASLIDPFTGEGIGNAMVSGMKAAEWVSRAVSERDFSKSFLSGYQDDVLGQLKSELRLGQNMQRLLNWKWLLNQVIAKASRSPDMSRAISYMFEDMSEREKLVSPLFYLRLLFA